jgi:hypothetical protein
LLYFFFLYPVFVSFLLSFSHLFSVSFCRSFRHFHFLVLSFLLSFNILFFLFPMSFLPNFISSLMPSFVSSFSLCFVSSVFHSLFLPSCLSIFLTFFPSRI